MYDAQSTASTVLGLVMSWGHAACTPVHAVTACAAQLLLWYPNGPGDYKCTEQFSASKMFAIRALTSVNHIVLDLLELLIALLCKNNHHQSVGRKCWSHLLAVVPQNQSNWHHVVQPGGYNPGMQEWLGEGAWVARPSPLRHCTSATSRLLLQHYSVR